VSGEPQVVKPEVFAAEVRELLGDLRAPSHGRGEGKILALDVHGALQVTFDTVFLLGLTEGSFPRRAHGDPLLSDALRARLARRGLPVRQRVSDADEEAYLFQLAVSAATHRLYLCYSDTDAAGQPILRSYYLDEAERLLPALKTVGQGLRQLRLRDVVPTLWNAASYRELAERVLWLRYNAAGASDAPFRNGAEHLLSAAGGPFRHASTAAQVERLRSGWTRTGPRLSDQPPLGVYDGDLGEVEAVLRELNRRFGPTAIFSASSLGKYGHCPMSFMFERLLGIEELPEPAAELEPANLGLLVHTTLARFYSDRVQAGKGRVSEEEVELARSEVLEAAEKTFRKFESCGRTGHELLWPLTKEAVRKKLCIWVEAEANALTELLLTDLQPCFFEHSYGNEPDNALVLETQQVGPVRVRGRIDRIDLVGDDGFFLFDYKTGRTVPESRDILEGRDLQMPLYALAGERLLFHGQDGPSRICKGWAYVRVGWPAKGTAEKVFEKTKRDYGPGERARKWSFQELIDESIEWVGKHVANIRQGRFTWPQTCPKGPSYHCPYEFLCRYEFRKALRRRMAEELTAGVEDGSNDDGG
ncbi:MAG: PD-(D/E)XK nuclease family protein, partial [Armatimonadetes bacterium]|nr:PD-(D/E)XK nuclease family protein [Armatimonadota bacterium]